MSKNSNWYEKLSDEGKATYRKKHPKTKKNGFRTTYTRVIPITEDPFPKSILGTEWQEKLGYIDPALKGQSIINKGLDNVRYVQETSSLHKERTSENLVENVQKAQTRLLNNTDEGYRWKLYEELKDSLTNKNKLKARSILIQLIPALNNYLSNIDEAIEALREIPEVFNDLAVSKSLNLYFNQEEVSQPQQGVARVSLFAKG